ncbi:YqeG family HAD IIIA-type phosphatase [Anaerobacillus alkaliphilus]|uniref:YqeG family HAD IIIA-type phosphatase n=1 Tax=Anaerobacillus alkaliphilus TaxID=1548597 RepID=A0A4Q0VTG8_9BACI|nr:YqeG family HAD IIIA-type phosphatase [Anaerobacillus alkaliphilus]RXJ00718.1 YqeG family HAD IIIA-type phosphatase [Anaerobacillus alkaliphilus]
MKIFKPSYEFEHFTDVSLQFLKDNNVHAIFSDLDSTLAAHDQLGDDQFTRWHERLEANQIKLIVVSNNSQGRVDRFTKPYNIPGYGRCNKPAPSKIRSIMKEIGVKETDSIFLGDQLFTDVLCGKLLKMKTVLVKPLGIEHEPWTVRWKRGLEASIKKMW